MDIRTDTGDQTPSVLEVNANCFLSDGDWYYTGYAIKLMGWDYPALLLKLIRQSLERAELTGG